MKNLKPRNHYFTLSVCGTILDLQVQESNIKNFKKEIYASMCNNRTGSGLNPARDVDWSNRSTTLGFFGEISSQKMMLP